jgi:hypothetical protein
VFVATPSPPLPARPLSAKLVTFGIKKKTDRRPTGGTERQ